MGTLIAILAMTFMAIGVIGWLWITVMAFSEGDILWGVGCLIIGPLSLVYGIMNWYELKVPVIMLAVGFIGRVATVAISVAAS